MTQMLRTVTGILALVTFLVLSSYTPVSAQDQGEAVLFEDLDRWDVLALRAENAVDTQTGSEDMLAAMRARIVEYRDEFDAARSLNSSRISTLREQLAALGPAPGGEGLESESAEVAAKRQELNTQLNQLLAPIAQAQAAFLRADGLVGQIDQILRERQTEKLLSISPSPLNPANWPTAFTDLKNATHEIWREQPDFATARKSQTLRDGLAPAIILGLLGLVLILRGRRWSTMIVGQLRHHGARGLSIWRFLVSLLRIILPLAGIVLLVAAVIKSGQIGPKGTEILFVIPIVSGFMLGFRWISERLFSRDDDEALIALPPQTRKSLRLHVNIITVMIVIRVLLIAIVETGDPALATKPVLSLPFIIVMAVSLFRIGRILRGYSDDTDAAAVDTERRVSTFRRVLHGLGLGAMLVAIVAPLMMAAGLYEAADALLPPFILTLFLLGLVMTLQRFSADLYGTLTGQGVEARDALMPVLFGMCLMILVTPVMALAWGARLTDLTELWSRFGRGFSVGDARISPSVFVTFAIIFAFGYILTRLIQGTLRSNVLPKTKIDIGGQNAIVSGLGYVGIFLAAIAAITGAGIDLSSLAIVAGALSVGLGFGLQNIVSNFVSGIILLIERPISQGDWIEVGGQMGYVRDISVRSTRIETFDRTDVIVPNADLISGTVTNFTRGNTVGRVIIRVGVAYGTDTRQVDRILREIAEAQPMVLAVPPPNVVFMSFGADALEFEVRMMLRDVNWTIAVTNEVNHAIAERFMAEKIEIPFAQRDLWIRNPEALTGAGPIKAPKTPKGKGTS